MPILLRAIDQHYAPIDALLAVIRDAYTNPHFMSEEYRERYPDASAFTAELADLAKRPGALFLVAEIDRVPRGYLAIRPRHQARLRHTADLQMAVDRRARGQGVGRRLIDEALARSERSEIVEIVYLMVRADNLPAIHLYETTGFDRLAVLHRDTKIGERYYDGVLMRRFAGRLSRRGGVATPEPDRGPPLP